MHTGQKPVLDNYQGRGSLAAYWNELNFDLKSVAASGWNAELIPDEEILQSQFPKVLKELRNNEARKEELDAIFSEVNDLEEDAWQEDEYDVWPSKELKLHKDAIKAMKGELKETNKEYKNLQKRIKANKDAGTLFITEVTSLTKESGKLEAGIAQLDVQIKTYENRIAKHTELEEELKQCKKIIKQIKDRKQNLVDQARLLILPEEAKELILKRWNRELHQTINGYLQTHQHLLLQGIELIWDKYTTPLHHILSVREIQAQLLNGFLKELGYE